MSRYHSYLQTAGKVLEGYHGAEPFAIFIRNFFAKEKKYGSRDRKAISSICYAYFRTAHIIQKQHDPENLIKALYLCGEDAFGTLRNINPGYYDNRVMSIDEKLQSLNKSIDDVFPLTDEISDRIDIKKFSSSLLVQPSLFLRIRPGRKQLVVDKLKKEDIPLDLIGENSIRLNNQTKVDSLIEVNRDAVIQDLSSQQVFDHLMPYLQKNDLPVSAWDCCAASGGKSILLYDLLQGKVNITVSDIRKNILMNLHSRLKEAGVPVVESFRTDLTVEGSVAAENKWPLIICDAPCTGSGTWARTPEQYHLPNSSLINEYVALQEKIVTNATSHLIENGIFVYITCSVFSRENELMASFISHACKLRLLEQHYLKGYDLQADSMFVAIFRK